MCRTDIPIESDGQAAIRLAALADRQLALLYHHAGMLADRVEAGQIGFIDAVDIAYQAALAAGMDLTVGDDEIQGVLHFCFGPARAAAGLQL
jgi:hypothetical protein